MNPIRQHLRLCGGCGRFVRPGPGDCPFCGDAADRTPRSTMHAALGFAALSFFGMVAVPGCAYGAPPDCTLEGCPDGYTCNETTGDCDPESASPEP